MAPLSPPPPPSLLIFMHYNMMRREKRHKSSKKFNFSLFFFFFFINYFGYLLMSLKPPVETIQHAVIDLFSINDGKLSIEQQIEVYGKY